MPEEVKRHEKKQYEMSVRTGDSADALESVQAGQNGRVWHQYRKSHRQIGAGKDALAKGISYG